MDETKPAEVTVREMIELYGYRAPRVATVQRKEKQGGEWVVVGEEPAVAWCPVLGKHLTEKELRSEHAHRTRTVVETSMERIRREDEAKKAKLDFLLERVTNKMRAKFGNWDA